MDNNNEELETLTPDTMEGELKKRSQKRFLRAFIIADIVLALYIIYSLVMLFTNL